MTSDDNKNIKQNSEPKKNMFGLEIMPDLEVNLSEAKKKSIKLWLIIGTVLLPLILFTGRAIINFDGVAFLFLLIYLVTVPLCYGTIKAVNNTKSKFMLQRWATLSALLCSLIGGLILLLEITKVEKEYKEGRGKILEKHRQKHEKKLKKKRLLPKKKK